MSRKMRKNSFVEGTLVAYVSIVITKLLGALYSIPLYNIIGEQGGVIYSCAYNIYALFLDVSTAGIPIAVSIIVSEYNALEQYKSKEKAYSVALRAVLILSLTSFALLQLFAWPIGRFFLDDMDKGVKPEAIAAAVRVVSFCLLVAPLLSIKRGYLQGHKFIAISSTSQVIEQIVRIAVVLTGVYVTIVLMRMSDTVGVCVALSGAAIGALAALIYLQVKSRGVRETADPALAKEERPAETLEILRKVLSYCTTIVIMSVSLSIYSLVDMKMLLTGLHHLRFPDRDTQVIASVASTWAPKIGMIITALAMGLVNSIAPHMAESRTVGDHGGINFKLNQALGIIVLFAVPMGIGMMLFAEPIYRVFYGTSAYGYQILRAYLVVTIIGGMVTVTNMSMQSIGRGRTVCIVTVIGIVVNASLDLPMIYLFARIGIPPFLGAIAASVIGQITALTLLLGSLKRVYYFKYFPVLKVFLKELPALAVMAAVELALIRLWPVTPTRGLFLVLQLGIFALCGAAVYFVIAYLTGAVNDVIGRESIARVLGKFKRS